MNKFDMLNEIQKVSPIFKQVNPTEFRIRCPICGDSQKDPNDSHCYIHCSKDPNEPMVYNCFLRNCHGVVNQYFLKKLGIDKSIYNQFAVNRSKRLSLTKVPDVNMIIGDPIIPSMQTKYIEDRLGDGFTMEDYSRFKIIWDYTFIRDYLGDKKVAHTLPLNDSNISFLTDDKCMIASRTFLSSEKDHQWRKIKLMASDGHSYYTIKSTLDLFTSDQIVLNIAEGIFDILSVYRNFNDTENSVFLAALGSDYISALDYLINKGFIGSNIDVRIYIDDGIDEETLKDKLKNRKWLFHSITIFKNIIYKDIGVRMDQIKLISKKV